MPALRTPAIPAPRFLLSALVIGTIVFSGMAGTVQADDTDSNAEVASSVEMIEVLLQQHSKLLEEVEHMRGRIESLSRAVREGAEEKADDVSVLLKALGSDDYRARNDATDSLRRVLVDRLWLLIESPDLDPEAGHRLKSLLVETSSMVRLTEVAIQAGSAERDALWNLVDTDARWVLTVLGDDPEAIQLAFRQPPTGHELAREMVIAAIVRDSMRPIPQIIALNQIDDASSPLLREALFSLLTPGPKLRIPGSSIVTNSRDRVAELAIKVLARRPSPELVGFFLAYLKSEEVWSSRIDYTIVETLITMRATEAVPALLEIAQHKRENLHGSYGLANVMMKPGDGELIGAAILLGLDLEALQIKRKNATNGRDPTYYGFKSRKKDEHPDRISAFDAISRAVEEAGPFRDIIGLDEALERFNR